MTYSDTENFVDYCNTMMITTESWKEYTNKIDAIKHGAKTKGDLKSSHRIHH